ncbi:MAG: hypothetical protein EXR54_01840 [Dehalococcoidia bacterium]|nr:hypothetical protein [Dehalococcoidia bacterium]MSQ16301.1 hypothetical protein [Dehalococcoidia bacterium]
MTSTAAMPEGHRLPSITKTLTQDKIDRFESLSRALRSGQEAPPPSNIHPDAAQARRLGLPGPIASGQMSFAYLHELLARQFGDDFLWGGHLAVTFVKPVAAGDTVIAQGLVRECRAEGRRIHYTLEVWLENQRGERTSLGEAQVTVPSPLRE